MSGSLPDVFAILQDMQSLILTDNPVSFPHQRDWEQLAGTALLPLHYSERRTSLNAAWAAFNFTRVGDWFPVKATSSVFVTSQEWYK